MKSSYDFLNILIQANSLSMKSIATSFIMLTVICKTKAKALPIFHFFSEIMVAEHGICGHDLRNEVEILVKNLFLFSTILFNIMNVYSHT